MITSRSKCRPRNNSSTLPSSLTIGPQLSKGQCNRRALAICTRALYECMFARYGLFPAQATDTVETRAASEAESELLHIEPWSPVLVVTRVAHLDDGRPFEVAIAVSRGDRYEYRVKL